MAAIAFAAWRTYMLWQEEPWSPPQYARAPAPAAEEEQTGANSPPAASISPETIIGKNLFDPERGAGVTREVEFNSRAFQRIRNMILLGTVIIGEERSAILQDAATTGNPAAPSANAAPMRVKLGEAVEGFRLSEIAERRVVFTKGGSRVEVVLDYFRKVDPAPARPAGPAAKGAPPSGSPRVIPNVPRKGAVPTRPSPSTDS